MYWIKRFLLLIKMKKIIFVLRILLNIKIRNEQIYIIQNWLRNRSTIEFLGIWEQINNTNFKPTEFDGFKNQAGLNSFVLTPKQWIEKTNAIGIISKAGRYGGGTFAHKDIAFEFALKLNEIAIIQMQSLTNNKNIKHLTVK